MSNKIRIKTKDGKIKVVKNATITRWIMPNGNQYHTAHAGTKTYIVIRHDFTGSIWGERE